MKVFDIIKIQNVLHSVKDFVASNTDSDESGIGEEMLDGIIESDNILQKEKERIYLRNAMIVAKRKIRKKQ